MAGVFLQEGDISSVIMKHDCRITGAWLDFRGGRRLYAMYFLHSEGMSTSIAELHDTMWKSMIMQGTGGSLGVM